MLVIAIIALVVSVSAVVWAGLSWKAALRSAVAAERSAVAAERSAATSDAALALDTERHAIDVARRERELAPVIVIADTQSATVSRDGIFAVEVLNGGESAAVLERVEVGSGSIGALNLDQHLAVDASHLVQITGASRDVVDGLVQVLDMVVRYRSLSGAYQAEARFSLHRHNSDVMGRLIFVPRDAPRIAVLTGG